MDKVILTCIRGGRRGARHELVEPVIVLGRRPGTDVTFDAQSDTKASGRHAELRRDGGRWVLRDLESTNGTFVDDVRVEGEVEVRDGVNVEFGKGGPIYNVRFVDDAPATVMADAAALGGSSEPSAADGLAAPAPSGRTAIYRAMMQETARKSSSGLKWVVGLLTLVLVGGGIGAWVYIQAQRQETDEQKKKTAALEEQTTDLEKKLKKTRKELARAEQQLGSARENLATTTGKLTDLRIAIEKAEGEAKVKLEAQAAALERTKAGYEAQLKKQEEALAAIQKTGMAAENIASQYDRSLFMLITVAREGQFGFCTAFAVDASGLLATNAHCVRVINDNNARGIPSVARMNGHPDKTWPVVQWRSHPSYRGVAFSTDVALVRIDLRGESLPAVTVLASNDTVRQLAPGQAIYTMGFPGKVMNERAPTADFRAAVISRLTTFDNASGDVGSTRMVWHSALTSKGTSGSPIFNAAGEVVAVNNGGLSARSFVVTDPTTGTARQEVAYDATGLNFGIRVDALREILP